MNNLIFLLLLLSFACDPKSTIDKKQLAIELDSIMVEDQKYRDEIMEAHEEFGWNSTQADELWKKQHAIDQSNQKRILEIIEQVDGYPGKSMVGNSASTATFYVLQHAPDSIQEKYYELIINAAIENELDKVLAAMYQDRYLMQRGEPQIYGSQIKIEYEPDSLTGKNTDKVFLWPIADTTNIDSLRMEVGMGPLEDYLTKFDLSRWE